MGTGASTNVNPAALVDDTMATEDAAVFDRRHKRSSKEAALDDVPRTSVRGRRHLARRLSREECEEYSRQQSWEISSNLFSALDTYGDGRLSIDELAAVSLEYFDTLATSQPERWVRVMIQKHDADGDGEVRAHALQWSPSLTDSRVQSALTYLTLAHPLLSNLVSLCRFAAHRGRIFHGSGQPTAVLISCYMS